MSIGYGQTLEESVNEHCICDSIELAIIDSMFYVAFKLEDKEEKVWQPMIDSLNRLLYETEVKYDLCHVSKAALNDRFNSVSGSLESSLDAQTSLLEGQRRRNRLITGLSALSFTELILILILWPS